MISKNLKPRHLTMKRRIKLKNDFLLSLYYPPLKKFKTKHKILLIGNLFGPMIRNNFNEKIKIIYAFINYKESSSFKDFKYKNIL